MKRVLTVAAVLAIAIPAFASSELTINRVNGVNSATYSMANGKLSPAVDRQTVTEMWGVAGGSGWYFGSMAADRLFVDWGDLGNPSSPSIVEGLQFAYAVPVTLTPPETVDALIVFYGDYSGFNANGFYGTYGFIVTNLPTTNGTNNGWLITIDLEDPNDPNFDLTFPILGNDVGPDPMIDPNINSDGEVDFGYSYWFPDRVGQGLAIGPFLATLDLTKYGPTVALAEQTLGSEDVFDSFQPDPLDPNNFLYEGSYWFGGWDPNDPNTAYAGAHMRLYGAGAPGCPNPGASGFYCTADIDGSGDCIVNLADLGALLPDYNATGAGLPGDIDNDGDVDLSDLGTLLSQYLDNCN